MTSKYKILIDDIFFSISDSSGIARLWLNLLSYFDNNPEILADKQIQIVILNRTNKTSMFKFPKIDFPNYDYDHPAADRLLISKFLKHLKFDLFVSTYLTFPLGTPSLMLVYDLIPEVFRFSTSSRGWLERSMQIIHASKFLCISNNTKKDLLKYYPSVSPTNVSVEYPGIDNEKFTRSSQQKIDQFRQRFNLEKYIVFVGARNGEGGYKNGDLLFRALAAKSFNNLSIFFVGGEPFSLNELLILKNSRVNYLQKKLADDDLITCLSGADFLLYPSQYEGFGIPPLEALAVGTPVVTCDLLVFQETIKDFMVTVDLIDPKDLINLFEKGIPESVKLYTLQNGPNLVKKYKWEKFAKAFAECLYEQCKQEISKDAAILDKKLTMYTEQVLYLQN